MRATRKMATRMAASKGKDSWKVASSGASPILVGSLNAFLSRYWERAPTARRAMEFLEDEQEQRGGDRLRFDHFAFRTFGMDGCGIDALATSLQAFGYERRDNLVFEHKKLNAFWFSPPAAELPRVFVSELRVEAFPESVREIIARYARQAALVPPRDLFLSGTLGVLPWEAPAREDYDALAAASEYAAWTLVHGYSLNHAAVAAHDLGGDLGEIERLAGALEARGFALNSSGGVVKTSPDGGLRQIATIADAVPCAFRGEDDDDDAGGPPVAVPGPYIEFAQRLVLPEYGHLAEDEVREHHRRDGFEQGNADKIFESTKVA